MNGAKNYVFNLSWWKAVYCPPRCACSNRGDLKRANLMVFVVGENFHIAATSRCEQHALLMSIKMHSNKGINQKREKTPSSDFSLLPRPSLWKTVFCGKCSQLGCKQNFVVSFQDFKVGYQNNRSSPDYNQKNSRNLLNYGYLRRERLFLLLYH